MPCAGAENLPAGAVTLTNLWRQSAQFGASGSLMWHTVPAIEAYGDPMAVVGNDPVLPGYKQVNDALFG